MCVYVCIYIYIYIYVCVCVCVWRERGIETEMLNPVLSREVSANHVVPAY